MRPILLALLFLVVIIGSCKKNNSSPTTVNEINAGPAIVDGVYTGTFQRQTATGGQISNVTITFSGNTWTGQSQFAKYPALCRGTFKMNGTDSVSFENACAWTAEFDWTLILGGDYKIKMVDKTTEITRDYNGAFADVYKLTKQ